MTTIHMETERVREVIRMLNQRALELARARANLRSASQRLSMAWQGGSRSERFHRQFEALVRECEMRAQELQTLASRANHEVQEWENVDQNFSALIQRMRQNWLMAKAAASDFSPASTGQPPGPIKEFNWFTPISDTVTLGLKGLEHIPYRSWKGLGRWLNQMVGNMKAGWVGKMDRLGHFLRNPVVQHGGLYVLGVAKDLLDGDRLDRALGSEVIEMAAEMAAPALIGGAIGAVIGGVLGAGAGGVGIVPGAVAGATIGAHVGLEVYAVYQTVLAVGGIFSGGLQMAGASQEALWLQNTIEDLDIGEHIGDDVYDGIYHLITSPQPESAAGTI